jgi:hypothetical protein
MAESGATIEVVYALPREQRIVRLPHEPGMTAGEAVASSGLRVEYPEIDTQPLVLGVFGTRVAAEHVLEPGDRVEICRPLEVDPRDLRKLMLASGKVMGGAGEGPRPQRKVGAKS